MLQPELPGPPVSAATHSPAATRSSVRLWLAPPFTLFVFLLHIAVTMSRPAQLFGDPGTGWHLATGRYILDTGSIPRADMFSFTAFGRPWVSYSWLFEAAGAA